MNYTFDTEQHMSAYSIIRDRNLPLLLIGKAGTGKSTFLRYIINTIPKQFVVVAPSGIAARNVNGMTIHSFFRFPIRTLLPEDDNIVEFNKNSLQRKVIESMDTLIIDEISMLRADILDAIDTSLRKNTDSNLPFGGKQVILIGDIFQLEPVIKKGNDKDIINEIYKSGNFFEAKVLDKINLQTIELTKIYRQTDKLFIDILNKIRLGNVVQKELDILNKRVVPPKYDPTDFMLTLTTKNDKADKINDRKINSLITKSYIYKASVEGIYEEEKYPTKVELELKCGAQVILIRNDSESRKWANGSIGIIESLEEHEIIVKLEDGQLYSIHQEYWDNIEYTYDKKKKKIEQQPLGRFTQFPLKLAWAISIHKSQGMSFDKVLVDLSSATFASGQLYVALSRVRSLDGLYLRRKIYLNDIKVSDNIVDFYKKINKEKSSDGSQQRVLYPQGDINSNQDKENYNLLSTLILGNPLLLSKLVQYKSRMQRELADILTRNEIENIRDNIYNKDIIKKMAQIAVFNMSYLQNNLDGDLELFLIVQASCTILEELDYTEFNSYEGTMRFTSFMDSIFLNKI